MVRPAAETREEVEALELTDADEDRRPMGAGVGARLRIDSDLLREAEG